MATMQRADLYSCSPDRILCGEPVFVGPEAGFSEEERASLRAAGAEALSFADFNLRIETAAIAAAALLRDVTAE